MREFALDLKGCSKKDRKRVEKAIKSTGLKKKSESFRFQKNVSKYLSFDDKDIYYLINKGSLYSKKTIYKMPQDWAKIQSALGIEEAPIIPQNGEVWIWENKDRREILIARIKGEWKNKDSNNDAYSIIGIKDKFKANPTEGFGVSWSTSRRKATTEETAKLIAAEHENGQYWDDKNLIEIPDYVAHRGVLLKYLDNIIFKSAPLEALETQEAKKNQLVHNFSGVTNYVDLSDNIKWLTNDGVIINYINPLQDRINELELGNKQLKKNSTYQVGRINDLELENKKKAETIQKLKEENKKLLPCEKIVVGSVVKYTERAGEVISADTSISMIVEELRYRVDADRLLKTTCGQSADISWFELVK